MTTNEQALDDLDDRFCDYSSNHTPGTGIAGLKSIIVQLAIMGAGEEGALKNELTKLSNRLANTISPRSAVTSLIQEARKKLNETVRENAGSPDSWRANLIYSSLTGIEGEESELSELIFEYAITNNVDASQVTQLFRSTFKDFN